MTAAVVSPASSSPVSGSGTAKALTDSASTAEGAAGEGGSFLSIFLELGDNPEPLLDMASEEALDTELEVDVELELELDEQAEAIDTSLLNNLLNPPAQPAVEEVAQEELGEQERAWLEQALGLAAERPTTEPTQEVEEVVQATMQRGWDGLLGSVSAGLRTATMGVISPEQQAQALHQWETALASGAQSLRSGLSGLSGLAGSVPGAEGGDTLGADDTPSAGRITLDDSWQALEAEDMPPAMARLAQQVQQWAVQWMGAAAIGAGVSGRAGALGQNAGSANTAGEGQEADAYAVPVLGAGSGTQLMEQAVQASQSAQETGAEQGQEQARQEDLRFWLKGQHQRAEVVLQRDGQSVRVQVQLQGQQAHVVLHSDQEQMRSLLRDGMDELRDLLAQQGLTLADALVQEEGGASASLGSFAFGAEQQGSSSSQQEQEQAGAASASTWGRARLGQVQPALSATELRHGLPMEQAAAVERLNVYV